MYSQKLLLRSVWIKLLTVSRSAVLLKEKEQQSEQYEQTLQQLEAKHETDMSHFQQEHAQSAAKVDHYRNTSTVLILPTWKFKNAE